MAAAAAAHDHVELERGYSFTACGYDVTGGAQCALVFGLRPTKSLKSYVSFFVEKGDTVFFRAGQIPHATSEAIGPSGADAGAEPARVETAGVETTGVEPAGGNCCAICGDICGREGSTEENGVHVGSKKRSKKNKRGKAGQGGARRGFTEAGLGRPYVAASQLGPSQRGGVSTNPGGKQPRKRRRRQLRQAHERWSEFTCVHGEVTGEAFGSTVWTPRDLGFWEAMADARNASAAACDVLSASDVLKEHLRRVVVDGDAAATAVFGHVIIATQAHAAAELLRTLVKGSEWARENRKLGATLRALGSITCESSEMVLHTDERSMPTVRQAWAPMNIFVSRDRKQAMCTAHQSAIEQSFSDPGERVILQTWNPIVQLDSTRVIARTWFDRPVVTLQTKARIAAIQAGQGEGGVWLVGSYCVPGVPLLENAARSGLIVAEAIADVRRPWQQEPLEGEVEATPAQWAIRTDPAPDASSPLMPRVCLSLVAAAMIVLKIR